MGDIPSGIELNENWQPVTSGPTYLRRQVAVTGAACLLASGYIAGSYCFWDYILGLDLTFWKAMQFWALGVVTIPICSLPAFRGIVYCFSYASPKGLYAMLAAFALGGIACGLYMCGLPAIHHIVWKVFVAFPGFVVLPAIIADVIINVTSHFCVEWRRNTTKTW